MSAKNQPFIGINRPGFVATYVHGPSRVGLEAVHFNAVQIIPLHHAFKVRDGVFIRWVGVSDPPVEITYGAVWSTCCTRSIVGDEINPVIDISAVYPTIACAHAVCIGKVGTLRTNGFHGFGDNLSSSFISCHKPRPEPTQIFVLNGLNSPVQNRVVQPIRP